MHIKRVGFVFFALIPKPQTMTLTLNLPETEPFLYPKFPFFLFSRAYRYPTSPTTQYNGLILSHIHTTHSHTCVRVCAHTQQTGRTDGHVQVRACARARGTHLRPAENTLAKRCQYQGLCILCSVCGALSRALAREGLLVLSLGRCPQPPESPEPFLGIQTSSY